MNGQAFSSVKESPPFRWKDGLTNRLLDRSGLNWDLLLSQLPLGVKDGTTLSVVQQDFASDE